MLNPEDEVLVSLRTSFTRDEAVAKLLGWMRGPIFPQNIEMDVWGIPESQLPYMASLQGSLQDRLTELRQAARQRLIDAAESYARSQTSEAAPTAEFPYSFVKSLSGGSDTSSVSIPETTTLGMLSEKEDAVRDCDKLVLKAQTYLNDIEEEFAKGAASVLQVDQERTTKTMETHFTAKSIDLWSRQKYRISIFDAPRSGETEDDQSDYAPDVRTAKGDLTRRSADSLFVTFAVLMESFLEKSDDELLGSKGAPVVAAIAKHLSERAIKVGKRGPAFGQSAERIKDRIEEARSVKAKRGLQ